MTWTLRPWRMSDAGALAALLQDGRVRRMLRDGLPYPYTEADARAFLAETLASWTAMRTAASTPTGISPGRSLPPSRCGSSPW